MKTSKPAFKAIQLALALPALIASANAAPIYWTDWIDAATAPNGPYTSFAGNGVIQTPTSTVNVTYTNSKGVGFYQTGALGEIDYWANGTFGSTRNTATSPYTSAQVDNIPTGTDIVALMFSGTQTLTFSQPIANPVFSFVSLNGNGYGFDQDFEILSTAGTDGNDAGYWGQGSSYKDTALVGDNIEYQLLSNGGEPHGTIRFLGTFSSVTWRSLSDEYWNGFTVGVQGTDEEVNGPAVPEASTFLPAALAAGALLFRQARRKAKI